MPRQLDPLREAPNGGRTWWAHLEFTRINITPTILPKKIEDRNGASVYVRSTCDRAMGKGIGGHRRGGISCIQR